MNNTGRGTFVKGHKYLGTGRTLFKKGTMLAESHPQWKTEGIGYQGVHAWLRRTFGKANKCENSSCEGWSKAFQWALLKDKSHERKRENYHQLCSPCHHVYDETGHKAWLKRRANVI